MLIHTGRRRTFRHNLHLAILLSSTAGFVNAAGLVAFAVLTTNITGHAASLAISVADGSWPLVKLAALGLFLFLAGAFFSSWYIRLMGKHQRFVYSIPLLCELLVLVYVALFGYEFDNGVGLTARFAGSLLFVMGLQNALVSMVSGSVVRTTHLTGMFTDFGIALAELVHKKFQPSRILRQRLTLHISIIFCFLAGGITGAMGFEVFGYSAFVIPAALVLVTMVFDVFRMRMLLWRRRLLVLQRKNRRNRLRRGSGRLRN